MLTKLKQQYKTDKDILTLYLWSFLYGTKSSKINFYNWQELVTKLASGKSLIRFGDGEAALISGRDIFYQVFNPRLREELLEILTTYSESSPYILAVPAYALTDSSQILKQKKAYRIWRLFRIIFKNFAPNYNYYTDAHLFYYKDTFAKLVKPIIRNRHIIIVTKEGNILPEFISTLSEAAIVDIVITPAENSYASSSLIKNEIEKKLFGVLEKPLIIFSCGPAAKTLAFYFSKNNIQALDLGAGIEIIGKNQDYSNRI